MTRSILSLTALVVGVVLLDPAPSAAQGTPTAERQALTSAGLTEAQARAELNYLSPAVRAQVEQRATGGNTVRGVMETMLLNNVSQLFAAQKVLAVDFIKGIVVFEGPGGQVRSYPFDATVLEVKR